MFETNRTTRLRIVHLKVDGTLDPAVESGIFNGRFPRVRAIKPQPDGKILVGGEFSSYQGTPAEGLVRLNANGSADKTFNIGVGVLARTNALRLVNRVAVLPDNAILIAGSFESVDGAERSNVARLLGDPSADEPKILAAGYSGQTFRLWVSTLAGQRYVLERTGEMRSGSWSAATSVVAQTDTIQLEDRSPRSQHFYRVRVESK